MAPPTITLQQAIVQDRESRLGRSRPRRSRSGHGVLRGHPHQSTGGPSAKAMDHGPVPGGV